MDYSLAQLAKGKRRRKGAVLLPEIHASLSSETALLRLMRSVLRELLAIVRKDIMPQVEMEKKRAKSSVTGDVSNETFSGLRSIVNALEIRVLGLVSRILGLEAQRHTKAFINNAKRQLGIDLSAVVRNEDLEGVLEIQATRQAGLIKGIADDTVRKIQTLVTSAVIRDIPNAELQKQLTESFGMADRRAKLIARDQTAKVTAELNELRHRQAGITQYVWLTARDERVRNRHRNCEGKTYTYGKPTDAEGGLPPGQPINCRCVAKAIVNLDFSDPGSRGLR